MEIQYFKDYYDLKDKVNFYIKAIYNAKVSYKWINQGKKKEETEYWDAKSH